MKKQEKAAFTAMLSWLHEDNVLKNEPEMMECVREFDLHNLRYYMFRFKELKNDPWLLGVCGGYEEDDDQHCGHVFSRYLEYNEETALQDAITIVEMIRTYWMRQAEEQINKTNNMQEAEESTGGNFNGFVLMDTHDFDVMEVMKQIKADWGIDAEVTRDEDASENAVVFEVDGMLAAVSFIDAPVPDGEAEYFAKSNYFWKDAVEVSKQHVAQILLAVLGHDQTSKDAGILFVKIASSALKSAHALGIYTSGTVYQPEMYLKSAQDIKAGGFPLSNLVYFGMYYDDGKLNGYTYGMKNFHKEEMEVLKVDMEVEELLDFLFDIAYYVITSNVVLKDGETIGFSEQQKLPITYSQGVAIEGNSLKIHL